MLYCLSTSSVQVDPEFAVPFMRSALHEPCPATQSGRGPQEEVMPMLRPEDKSQAHED